jgi:phage portal protein BeeE
MWPFDLFRTKAKPIRSDSDEPFSPVFTITGTPVRFLSISAVMTAEAARKKCPQLFRVIHLVSTSVQSVPWYCEEDPEVIASERANAGQIKAINNLLKSPNENFTPEAFRYWMTSNLMLYNRVHFKVGVGSLGNPNGMYPLDTKYVKGILNNRGTVEEYIYGEGMETEQKYLSRRSAEKRKQNEAYAAEISFPSLSGRVEYNSMPAAIECLMVPLAIITCLMQRALDTASGHPNIKYVVTAEKTLTKAQHDALKKHLEDAGPEGEDSGSVLFLYNTTVDIHKLDNDLQDIHSKIPLDDMTRQVAGVFGVPIALLGLGSADAAKYANNYEESRLAFWQDTIVPAYLKPTAAGMTAMICPPGARIAYDLDAIPALWAGRALLGKTLSSVNCLTTDEKRDILGFQPEPRLPIFIPVSGATGGDTAPADQPSNPNAGGDGNVVPLQPQLVNGR